MNKPKTLLLLVATLLISSCNLLYMVMPRETTGGIQDARFKFVGLYKKANITTSTYLTLDNAALLGVNSGVPTFVTYESMSTSSSSTKQWLTVQPLSAGSTNYGLTQISDFPAASYSGTLLSLQGPDGWQGFAVGGYNSFNLVQVVGTSVSFAEPVTVAVDSWVLLSQSGGKTYWLNGDTLQGGRLSVNNGSLSLVDAGQVFPSPINRQAILDSIGVSALPYQVSLSDLCYSEAARVAAFIATVSETTGKWLVLWDGSAVKSVSISSSNNYSIAGVCALGRRFLLLTGAAIEYYDADAVKLDSAQVGDGTFSTAPIYLGSTNLNGVDTAYFGVPKYGNALFYSLAATDLP